MYQVSRALRRASGALIVSVGLALAPPVAVPSQAASSTGCEGGGFVISGLNDRSTIGIDGRFTITADNLGDFRKSRFVMMRSSPIALRVCVLALVRFRLPVITVMISSQWKSSPPAGSM